MNWWKSGEFVLVIDGGGFVYGGGGGVFVVRLGSLLEMVFVVVFVENK